MVTSMVIRDFCPRPMDSSSPTTCVNFRLVGEPAVSRTGPVITVGSSSDFNPSITRGIISDSSLLEVSSTITAVTSSLHRPSSRSTKPGDGPVPRA